MSESVCLHDKTRPVGDVPIADPETGEFLGRFDVIFCELCGEYTSMKLIEAAPTPPDEMPTRAV